MTNPFGHSPFQHNPFDGGGLAVPGPPQPPAPPRVHRDEANTLATLSVVFAFVFAPVGALLGHLGLAQIRHSGQRGRDRALVGVTLSYVFITVAVVALAVWATEGDAAPRQQALPPAKTTSTHSTAPPPPTVAPGDLAGLIPTLDQIKAITGDQNIAIVKELHQPTADATLGITIDRPECWGSLEGALPDDYGAGGYVGWYTPEFDDSHDPFNAIAVAPTVASFRDAATAQAQLAKLQSGWRQCGGSSVKITGPSGPTFTFSINGPTDVGNGISIMELVPQGMSQYNVHAIGAKANVVVDLLSSYTGSNVGGPARQTAVAVANQILNKIPG